MNPIETLARASLVQQWFASRNIVLPGKQDTQYFHRWTTEACRVCGSQEDRLLAFGAFVRGEEKVVILLCRKCLHQTCEESTLDDGLI